jgi:NTE family protein
MKAFAIFEGGGAKGIAHVGALRACEDYGIEFCGVAGASAGAIVAALVAAGYKSVEMFDASRPGKRDVLFSQDLRGLIQGRVSWPEFEMLAEDLSELSRSEWPKLKLAWYWLFKHANAKRLVSQYKGLFSAQSFAARLDVMLEKKLLSAYPHLIEERKFGHERKAGEGYRVMFADVTIPLKIVATNLSDGRVIEFSATATPQVPVALAVAASIAIPLVFEPVTIKANGQEHGFVAVDGGVLSNFPAWLFDAERANMGPHIPSLGFRLVVAQESPRKLVEGAFASFARRLLTVAINGDPLLETRQIDNMREVPLRVSASTFDFDMTPGKKVALFGEGYQSARTVFGTPGFPVEPERVQRRLAAIVHSVKSLPGAPEGLVRACVVCPTTRHTLRVTYTHAMDTDKDTDDLLELNETVGASGQVWQTGAVVRVDMGEAAATFNSVWGMTKHQQALVRDDLKALVAMPISSSEERLLGVLSLDSPDGGMLDHFERPEVEAALWAGAKSIAAILERGAVGNKEHG